MTLALTLYLGKELPDPTQDVLELLKATLDHPKIFVAYALLVAVMIPIVEEIIFRGIIQNFTARFLPIWSSIFLTSFIFAMCHVTYGQGIGNLQIIPGLFVLSGLVGYLYEREKKLLAPIGLHIAVNTVSTIAIFS